MHTFLILLNINKYQHITPPPAHHLSSFIHHIYLGITSIYEILESLS